MKLIAAALEYAAHGWALVPVRGKAPLDPNWPQQPRRTAEAVAAWPAEATGIGLVHAHSGTACLDADDIDAARAWMAARGVDLDALLSAPDAVRIVSGRPGRAKALYRWNGPPLRTVAPRGAGFELRGAGGQDLLPPSIHPETGRPYAWAGDWRALPPLPAPLLRLWGQLLADQTAGQELDTGGPLGADPEHVREWLAGKDPDLLYPEWLKIGMALHHEFGEAGFRLWNEWSAKGRKYRGPADLLTHWRTFRAGKGGAATLRSVGFTPPVAAFPDVSTQPQAAPKHRFVRAPEYARRPPPTWLVKGVLPDHGLTVLYGPSGAGKTFVALDMAAAIARGALWHGRRTVRAPVAYIAAEGSGGLALRLAAYQREYPDADLSSLWVLADRPNFLTGGHKDVIEGLQAIGEPVRLVVVDTLARVMPGGDENSGETMGAVIERCEAITRATGAAVMLVHHAGKDASKGARGWSGLRAAVDAEIAVQRDAQTGRRWVTLTKEKDGIDGLEIDFTLRVVPLGYDADGDLLTSCVVADPPVGLEVVDDKQEG